VRRLMVLAVVLCGLAACAEAPIMGTVVEKRLEAAHIKHEKCGLYCWQNVDVPERPLLLIRRDDGSDVWREVSKTAYNQCDMAEVWPDCGYEE